MRDLAFRSLPALRALLVIGLVLLPLQNRAAAQTPGDLLVAEDTAGNTSQIRLYTPSGAWAWSNTVWRSNLAGSVRAMVQAGNEGSVFALTDLPAGGSNFYFFLPPFLSGCEFPWFPSLVWGTEPSTRPVRDFGIWIDAAGTRWIVWTGYDTNGYGYIARSAGGPPLRVPVFAMNDPVSLSIDPSNGEVYVIDRPASSTTPPRVFRFNSGLGQIGTPMNLRTSLGPLNGYIPSDSEWNSTVAATPLVVSFAPIPLAFAFSAAGVQGQLYGTGTTVKMSNNDATQRDFYSLRSLPMAAPQVWYHNTTNPPSFRQAFTANSAATSMAWVSRLSTRGGMGSTFTVLGGLSLTAPPYTDPAAANFSTTFVLSSTQPGLLPTTLHIATNYTCSPVNILGFDYFLTGFIQPIATPGTTFTLTVPNSPSFNGTAFYAQWLGYYTDPTGTVVPASTPMRAFRVGWQQGS